MKHFRNQLGMLSRIFCVSILSACVSEPPEPRIQFHDRPSALAPSNYRSGETETKQEIVASDFVNSDRLAFREGVQRYSAEHEVKATARAKRDAEWRAAGSPISCPHCRSGSVTYTIYGGIFGERYGSRPCTHCHGTGYVSAVRP
jgi:DnaJ-class molecular chaperone